MLQGSPAELLMLKWMNHTVVCFRACHPFLDLVTTQYSEFLYILELLR
jgi:hypothetical protein